MFKKFFIICISVFLITLNAQAGSDGDLSLKNNNQKEVRDCFENLNRATFALNQTLDKAIIKPIVVFTASLAVFINANFKSPCKTLFGIVIKEDKLLTALLVPL